MRSKLSRISFSLGALAVLILSPVTSQAAISGFGAGVSVSNSLGEAYRTLGQAVGFQAELSWQEPWMGKDWDIRLDGSYHGFDVTNLSGAKIAFIGMFGGIETARRMERISPFFGLEIGGVYDNLSLSGGSTIQNNGFGFAAKIAPGVDVPLFNQLGLSLEFPVQFIFFENPVTTWNGVASVRWKL